MVKMELSYNYNLFQHYQYIDRNIPDMVDESTVNADYSMIEVEQLVVEDKRNDCYSSSQPTENTENPFILGGKGNDPYI